MSLNPFSLITGQVWKFATIGAGLVSLVLGGLLMASFFENRDLLSQRAAMVKEITDPKTGYVAQLAQAHTNEETLKEALVEQRTSFEIKAKERQAVLDQTAIELAAAQAHTHAMQVKLDSFLATKPKGATLEDRVRDIDQRGLLEMVE